MPHAQRRLVLRYLRTIAGGAGTGEVTDADLLARFVTRRDEASFELLLWRHGTMVLHLCRDVTRDAHAAEDAFQATFLALVRKAASIRDGVSLGAWLYRVAYRVALKARGQAAKRSERETAGVDVAMLPAVAGLSDHAELREVRPAVHEEVQRLPAKYRTLIVLCYIQGLTHEEAARQLGCPKGTVAGRLARARDLLRKRLLRRGVALSIALSAVAVAPASACANLPGALVQSTFRAALKIAAGQTLVGLVSPQVIALTEGVIHAMFWSKMKLLAAALLALGLVGGGVGLLAAGREAGRTSTEPESAGTLQDRPAPPRKSGAEQEPPAPDVRAIAAARAQSVNNLKQIALAMHNYHEQRGSFPPAAIYSKTGKPLLSWRVALLPYLEQGNLYRQFHLDEPWDSEHNKKLLNYKVKAYHIPGHEDWTRTFYQVFVGEDTIFERRKAGSDAGSSSLGAGGPPGTAQPGSAGGAIGKGGTVTGDNGPLGMRLSDISDGTSNTLLVVEGGTPVPWTKPEDLAYAPTGKLPALGGAFEDVIHAAFADGSVVSLRKRFNETALRAAITRNQSELYDREALIDLAPGADKEELKLGNERLRNEISDAHARIRRLQEELRMDKAALRKQGGEAETVEELLKQERQSLTLELRRLEHEIETLRDELIRVNPTRKRKPTEPPPEQ